MSYQVVLCHTILCYLTFCSQYTRLCCTILPPRALKASRWQAFIRDQGMSCPLAEERRLGFTYNRRGIILDPALRDVVDPAVQTCFDWAHNILQGVFQHTVWLLLCAVKSYGIVPEHINEYLQFWEWPHSTKGVTGKYIFKPYIKI